jgi:hypothetical protein
MKVGGGDSFLTDDFTISGKTIHFLTPPPEAQPGQTPVKIRATYQKK